MMINFRPIRGPYLAERLKAAGYTLAADRLSVTRDAGGAIDEALVQSIIDDNGILYATQRAELDRIKTAAAAKYAQYASAAPGKDAVYAAKQAEAVAHYNAGANDGPVGPYMQARINLTGETATAISAEWRAKSAAWNALAAAIDAIQDHYSAQINAASDWTAVDAIASAAVSAIEGLG